MVQTSDSGSEGAKGGILRAKDVAARIGAQRVHAQANLFRFDGRTILIKSTAAKRGTFQLLHTTVDAAEEILFVIVSGVAAEAYTMTPDEFAKVSSPSASKKFKDRARAISASAVQVSGKPFKLAGPELRKGSRAGRSSSRRPGRALN